MSDGTGTAEFTLFPSCLGLGWALKEGKTKTLVGLESQGVSCLWDWTEVVSPESPHTSCPPETGQERGSLLMWPVVQPAPCHEKEKVPSREGVREGQPRASFWFWARVQVAADL
jgi:hypothetical protein